MAEAGANPSGLWRLASRHPDLPPLPEHVVFLWGMLLDTERVAWGQAAAAFIREARKAGVPDEAIRQALMIDDDVDVVRYGEQVRAEAQAHARRRNGMSGWVLHPEHGSQD